MAEHGFALLTGLGIFLLGMFWLEQGIQSLGSRRLKHWLAVSTTSSWRSVSFGVLITSILQSSSMVSLLVLAFTSAGVIQLYNGIGILLGASVGTTVTGWLVILLGFELDLETVALPLLGISALVRILSKDGSRTAALATIFVGLGLLLFGLAHMKNAMADLPNSFDLYSLQGQAMWVYLLCGIAITALIQSSSATMMLTLTALHSGFILLPAAAAIMIGANIGTTVTTVLGSIAGSIIKKRLALASCIFHTLSSLLAFFVLLPLLPWLLSLSGVQNPLYGLVAFHSVFNIIGVLCLIPFLQQYTRWIERFFCTRPVVSQPSLTIPPIVPQVIEAALPALTLATLQLMVHALDNSLQHFQLYRSRQGRLLSQKKYLPPPPSHYEEVKAFEGQLLNYITQVQQQQLSTEQALQLQQLREACRGIVYACKTLNDIDHNLEALYSTDNDIDQQLFNNHQTFIKETFATLFSLTFAPADTRATIEQLLLINNQQQQKMDSHIYQIPGQQDDSRLPSAIGTWISSQLNTNHEVHHATKNLVTAIGVLLELQQHILPDLDYTDILSPTNIPPANN